MNLLSTLHVILPEKTAPVKGTVFVSFSAVFQPKIKRQPGEADQEDSAQLSVSVMIVLISTNSEPAMAKTGMIGYKGTL